MAGKQITYSIVPGKIDLSGFEKFEAIFDKMQKNVEGLTETFDKSFAKMGETSKSFEKSTDKLESGTKDSFKGMEKSGDKLEKDTKDSFQGMSKSASKESKKTEKSWKVSFVSMGKSAAAFGKKVAIGFGVGATAAAGGSILMAASAQEMQSKFDVVFDGMTDEVEDWATSYADLLGKSVFETKELLSNNADLISGLGATKEEAFDTAKSIQQLGIDLASFNNLQDVDAVEKLTKGLLGQHDVLQSMGIFMNEASLEQTALNLGYEESFKDLEQLEKVQVRFSAAMEQSANAIGDAENTVGSFTNQLKRLKNVGTDAFKKIGLVLIPDALESLTSFNESISASGGFFDEVFLPAIGKVADSFGVFVDSIKTVGTAISEAFGGETITASEFIIFLIEGLATAIEVVSGVIVKLAPLFAGTTRVIVRGAQSIVTFFKSTLVPVFEFWGEVFGDVGDEGEGIIDGLVGAFDAFFDFIDNFVTPFLADFGEGWMNFWEGFAEPVKDGMNGIIDFLTGVFLLDWELTWKGIVGIVDAASDALNILFVGIANDMIELINGVLKAINFLSGEFFAFPELPFIAPPIKSADFAAAALLDDPQEFKNLLEEQRTAARRGLFAGEVKPATLTGELQVAGERPQIGELFKEFQQQQLPDIEVPAFADGIRSFAGGTALVGERGPELVNLPKGSEVIPNNKSQKALQGGGFSPTTVFNITVENADESSTRKLVKTVNRIIDDRDRRTFSEFGLEV